MTQGLWKCVECRYTPSLRFFSVFSSGVAKKNREVAMGPFFCDSDGWTL